MLVRLLSVLRFCPYYIAYPIIFFTLRTCIIFSRSDSLSSTSTTTSTDGGNGGIVSSTYDGTENGDTTSEASTDIW